MGGGKKGDERFKKVDGVDETGRNRCLEMRQGLDGLEVGGEWDPFFSSFLSRALSLSRERREDLLIKADLRLLSC